MLNRRKAIAQDLQRENNRLEKADATDTPAQIRQSITDTITFLQQQLDKLQTDIDSHTNQSPPFKEDLKLLKSIPAWGELAIICSQLSTITTVNPPNN